MNLWLSSHVLVAGLFLTVSALTPEECQPLVTPLSLADRSVVYGRKALISGYADTDEYNAILNVTNSYRMDIVQSPFSSRKVLMHQQNRINGVCLHSTVNVTIDGDAATVLLPNMTVTYHLLPTCEGCLLLSANSTARGLDNLFRLLNLKNAVTDKEITTHALYLMANESTVKESDLEHFRQQASCLGFSREPDFHYDPEKGFCEEREGITLNLS